MQSESMDSAKLDASDCSKAERLRRLASKAISADHPRALRRYLQEGLDPNAIAHEGWGIKDSRSLLEAAAKNDRLECFKALVEGGAAAPASVTIVLAAIQHHDETFLVLEYLLSSGLLDPWGGYGGGKTWADGPPGPVTSLFLNARAQKEREILNIGTECPMKAARAPLCRRL